MSHHSKTSSGHSAPLPGHGRSRMSDNVDSEAQNPHVESRLMSLPPELRNEIYKLVVSEREDIGLPCRIPASTSASLREEDIGLPYKISALCRASKQLRKESMPLFFSTNTFRYAVDAGKFNESLILNIAPHANMLTSIVVQTGVENAFTQYTLKRPTTRDGFNVSMSYYLYEGADTSRLLPLHQRKNTLVQRRRDDAQQLLSKLAESHPTARMTTYGLIAAIGIFFNELSVWVEHWGCTGAYTAR